MRNKILEQLTDEQIIEAIAAHGSMQAAARYYGIPHSTFKDRAGPLMENTFKAVTIETPLFVDAPDEGVTRYIFSSAQTNTKVNKAFLYNLEAYAKHLNAEIVISGFSYKASDVNSPGSYDPSIQKYLSKRQINIGNKLLYCGEMNTNPTAVDPLSGFETYTRSMWGIFPHPRISLKSIPTMFSSPAKQIMTTGAVTERNYIQKKAGIKAEFHHVIAALLVEIDSDGDVFCRHLIAEKNGAFQDLTNYVQAGRIFTGWTVEAITWGDIHCEKLDAAVAAGAWGIDSEVISPLYTENVPMLDELMPKYQFFHDVLDFRRRNHHNVWDPHFKFERYARGDERVQDEIMKCAWFLAETEREWCKSVVVDSNHDRALTKWLKTADYRNDPANAIFFLRTQLAFYEAIERDDKDFLLFEWAVKQHDINLDSVKFLKNTDSFIICKEAGGGIECALHGDLGANGAKGNVASFAKMGPKANTADKHAAAIFEGIYQAGHSCNHDMGYNRGGLSSWTPSHIVTYSSGKRIIVTMQGSKYKAG